MAPDTPFKIVLNDQKSYEVFTADALSLDMIPEDDGIFHILDNHTAYRVEVVDVDYASKTFIFKINGSIYKTKIEDKYDQLVNRLGLSAVKVRKLNELRAPMPGLVLEVSVEAGQTVHTGDKLLILEAMKMENVIKSPGDGVVKSIKVDKGAAIEKGHLLIEFE